MLQSLKHHCIGITIRGILPKRTKNPHQRNCSGLKLEDLKYQLVQLQKKGYLIRFEGHKTGRWKVQITHIREQEHLLKLKELKRE